LAGLSVQIQRHFLTQNVDGFHAIQKPTGLLEELYKDPWNSSPKGTEGISLRHQ